MADEHTLDVNDPTRAYSQGGLYFLICACGDRFEGATVEEATRKFGNHRRARTDPEVVEAVEATEVNESVQVNPPIDEEM